MKPGAFPRTHEALSALPAGDAVLAHLGELEAGFGQRAAFLDRGRGPDAGAQLDFDVALAGGGLSLIYAAFLARAGWRVAVFDRRRIGHGHREWNISRRELAPLVESGLLSPAECDGLVALEYDHGIVRWHGGGTYPVKHVLDCVVRAEPLLGLLRDRAIAAGATLFDEHALAGYAVGPGGIAVWLAPRAGGETCLSAALLLDGTGASSPHGAFDLVCPTVGGVLGGLDEGSGPREVDYRIGEILASTEGVEDGKQHIWEGFPGPERRYTTYLFHYAEPRTLGEHPLFSLYERFFETLPRYKTGDARLEKATYGFIPAHTRLRPTSVAPRDRILLVGDAAGRHSPLTFCGFGSMIRSFLPVSRGLLAALEAGRLDRGTLAAAWREPAGLNVMGGLALMMVGDRLPAGTDPQAINRVLDAAFGALHDQGDTVYGAFVRDELRFGDFLTFMLGVARREPGVYADVWRRLSPRELASWAARAGAFALGRTAIG